MASGLDHKLKRALDIGLVAPALVALAPLLAVLALGVKLDSPGPVFFRQVRVGRHGANFRIWKFRSMTHQPQDTGPQITVGNDARITRVGALLRRYKLDELPQLFNVLAGEMSLVGPRPEVPKYVALYPARSRECVLSVRPGITDRASLEFSEESELLARSPDPERTYVDEILPRKLELYQRYVETWTVLGDLHLILRTLGVVVGLRPDVREALPDGAASSGEREAARRGS